MEKYTKKATNVSLEFPIEFEDIIAAIGKCGPLELVWIIKRATSGLSISDLGCVRALVGEASMQSLFLEMDSFLSRVRNV